MTNLHWYVVKVERVAEYHVEANSKDAAVATVRAFALESKIRQQTVDACKSYLAGGPVTASETYSASVYPRPVVWAWTTPRTKSNEDPHRALRPSQP